MHRLIGVEPDQLSETCRIADPIEPLTDHAIAYAGQSDLMEQTYANWDARPRERTALNDIILIGALN